MKKKMITTLVWVLATVLTLSAVIYQRKTGPTYPVKGVYDIQGTQYKYRLIRSESGTKNIQLKIEAPDTAEGYIVWKRYPTSQPFAVIPMTLSDGFLTGELPNQPPAGKLQYFVTVIDGNSPFILPVPGSPPPDLAKQVAIQWGSGEILVPIPDFTAIARYKGEVPAAVLIPHIICMFAGMLISNRAGIGVLFKQKDLTRSVILTFIFLAVGGLVFGCTVQYYAFGEPWTGFPIGHDLTDNKIGVALLAWLLPFVNSIRKKRRPSGRSILFAAFVTLVIFMIPHSAFGSELKYE